MSSEFDRGVMTTSSWHKEETIGVMRTALAMLEHGYESGALPTSTRHELLTTPQGLQASVQALVASYRNHPDRVVGENGARYREVQVSELATLASVAVDAGAQPTGVFSLRGGRRIVLMFDIGGCKRVRNKFMFGDSFDGSLEFTTGDTSTRIVCANTLGSASRQDGGGWSRMRHTTSLGDKIKLLQTQIPIAIQSGQRMIDMVNRAEAVTLEPAKANRAFDVLFPPAPADATAATKTRADNVRAEAKAAAALDINRVGGRGNLATLWNAATYLVDRRADGSARECRGNADKLDSMLFGTRGQRIQEIQELIEVIMADGKIQSMTRPAALASGVPAAQIPGVGSIFDFDVSTS